MFLIVAVGRPLHYMFQLWRWQMSLPNGKMEQPLFIVLEEGRHYCQVAGGIATIYTVRRWQMLLPSGRWNYHLGWVMLLGRCYNQDGRWNSHWVSYLMLFLVLKCYAEPHPRCVAGGICLCFYSGMDYWPLCKELPWWFSLGSGPLSHYAKVIYIAL